MNDLELTSSHDLRIEGGDLFLLNEEALVARQTLKINLLTLQGEWWEDLSIGIPYLQDILRKGVGKVFVDTIIKSAIEDSYNIASLDEFVSEITADRVYIIRQFRATTSGGEIISLTNQPII